MAVLWPMTAGLIRLSVYLFGYRMNWILTHPSRQSAYFRNLRFPLLAVVYSWLLMRPRHMWSGSCLSRTTSISYYLQSIHYKHLFFFQGHLHIYPGTIFGHRRTQTLLQKQGPWPMMSDYLTDSHDLTRLASSCVTCSNNIAHGVNIRHYKDLQNFNVSISSNKRVAIILNTKQDFETAGHWAILLKSKRTLYLSDGLGYTVSRPDVMLSIRRFCRMHGFRLVVLSLRYQRTRTSKCGYLCLGVLAKYHTLSFKRFLAMHIALKRNSIFSNETYLLNFAKKHFNFSI